MHALIKKQKVFFSLLSTLIKKKPYLAVIILHEYYRNLYFADEYLNFQIKDPFKRLKKIQNECILILKTFKQFGSYKIKFEKINNYNLKAKTGKVYGKLWKKFTTTENLKAKKFILQRFKNYKSFNKNFFKNKTIVDVGCGGGRYTNALKNLGAKKVFGVDYGIDGIKLAKSNYKRKNIFFKQQNVLNMNFSDNKFDIVFCNGVLHHTSDRDKGIKELIRICKPGGHIFLYLYGSGGLFWDARKRMNKIMKSIPEYYSQKVLDLIGLPTDRFIFMDNWYVPIETHSSHKEIYKLLKKLKVKKIQKMQSGRISDLETGLKKIKNSQIIWGEGDIRLLLKK